MSECAVPCMYRFFRRLNNNQYLLAASIAQQSSAASMVYDSKMVDRQIKYHQSRIKRAEKEVASWRQYLTPELMQSGNPNSMVISSFTQAQKKLNQVENDLDQFMASLNQKDRLENKYQKIVDTALASFHVPEDLSTFTPQAKKARAGTPMSSIVVPAAGNTKSPPTDDVTPVNDLLDV